MTAPDIPPGDPDSERVYLLRAILSGATLVMVALSWPLWIDLADFPAVPFVRRFPDYPREWSWLGLALIAAGLGLGMTRQFGKVGVGLTVVVMTWLIFGDQLRFQPWVYQFVILGTLLLVLSPSSALGFGRVWMALVYLHSGLSKLDVSFPLGMGRLFVRTLLRVLEVDALPDRLIQPTAVLLPAAEIVVALLLLVPRTRRIGYLGALLIHAALLLILGPWGLGHSTIVLIWNVALVVEEYLLFWPRDLRPVEFKEERPSGWGGRPCPHPGDETRRAGTSAPLKGEGWTIREKVVAIPFAALLVLPFGERAGLFDSWPSHALYADHCEGTTFYIEGDLPADLPADLRVSARPRVGGQASWTISPTDWTRRVRGVPAYPQVRYTNGLAEWLARRFEEAPWSDLYFDHRLRADPSTGRAGSLTARDLKEARELSGRFWFNAHPRDRSGR